MDECELKNMQMQKHRWIQSWARESASTLHCLFTYSSCLLRQGSLRFHGIYGPFQGNMFTWSCFYKICTSNISSPQDCVFPLWLSFLICGRLRDGHGIFEIWWRSSWIRQSLVLVGYICISYLSYYEPSWCRNGF